MTVSAQTPINRSTGNGVTTVFPYTFKIISSADIEVSVDGVVKTLNVDYTLSGVGVDAGGNVTMTTAPATATIIVRQRNMALIRTTDYQDQGELPATTLDDDIDATVLMIQQVDGKTDRAMLVPASVTGFSAELPVPVASRYLRINDTATAIDLVAVVTPGELTVSTFIETLIDDTTAAAARTTLGASASTELRSYLAGCGMSTAGSSATMSIAAGVAQDSTNSATMTLLAIAKTTSEWAVGTATGGFDRGASGTDVIGNNSWYHFYVIRRPDTGVVDVCFSASATAPTATGVIPAAYTQFRRIGSGRTNGSAQWTSFTQDGDYFVWSASVADVNTTNYGAGSAISATLTVPSGVKVDAMTKTMITDSVSPNTGFLLTDLSAADEAPTNGNNLDAFATVVGVPAICVKTIRTNTSSQVRYRNNGGAGVNTTTVIRTVGWYDTRGRNS